MIVLCGSAAIRVSV